MDDARRLSYVMRTIAPERLTYAKLRGKPVGLKESEPEDVSLAAQTRNVKTFLTLWKR